MVLRLWKTGNWAGLDDAEIFIGREEGAGTDWNGLEWVLKMKLVGGKTKKAQSFMDAVVQVVEELEG